MGNIFEYAFRAIITSSPNDKFFQNVYNCTLFTLLKSSI